MCGPSTYLGAWCLISLSGHLISLSWRPIGLSGRKIWAKIEHMKKVPPPPLNFVLRHSIHLLTMIQNYIMSMRHGLLVWYFVCGWQCHKGTLFHICPKFQVRRDLKIADLSYTTNLEFSVATVWRWKSLFSQKLSEKFVWSVTGSYFFDFNLNEIYVDFCRVQEKCFLPRIQIWHRFFGKFLFHAVIFLFMRQYIKGNIKSVIYLQIYMPKQ